VSIRIAVLLSIGIHPDTGRERRAFADSIALRQAMAIASANVSAWHAGDPSSEALRFYLGMGVHELQVIATDEATDPLDALSECMGHLKPDLILTGPRAERGLGSGSLPYAIADRLNWPIVCGVRELRVTPDEIHAIQALPKGRRRGVASPLPCVLVISPGAVDPPPLAYRHIRDGVIHVYQYPSLHSVEDGKWVSRPARTRPKRINTLGLNASVEDRMRVVTGAMDWRGARLLAGLTADEAAAHILDKLQEIGLLRPMPANVEGSKDEQNRKKARGPENEPGL
jgi:electron transfer flavoprotein beta subunit